MFHLILWWWSDGAGGVLPPVIAGRLPVRGLIVMHPVRTPVADTGENDRYEV